MQAVNAKRLKEIVVRSKLFSRYLEVHRSQIQDFVKSLFRRAHCFPPPLLFNIKMSSLSESAKAKDLCTSESPKCLRQVRMRVLTLGKFSKTSLHRRLGKEFAENIDLLRQLFIRNRLDKFLGRRRSPPVELPELSSRSSRYPQRLTFRRHLAHQSNLLHLGRVKTSTSEQQIANHSVPQITLQTGNPPKAGN